ncbi:hypothetical protein Ahy_B10g102065 [Arachis hypogaea]|uniref:Protein FAR1-RELATED SEQUENCE n=1 Tax=Arachis hypogaea TaxID=3818 RepID=A0A444X100_ARAHY|nr:hypothetical protein Ahy_B10g102065 [Arachis hypogaea]
MESSIGDEDSNYPSFDISDHFNQSEGNIENLSIDEDQHDDKITKEFKKPINQSIQCNWEGFRKSRVREATRKNTIAAMRYRARMQVKFDREKENWVLLKVELRHSHSCSAKKEVHYHKYREQTMHVKCVIEDNNEAGIRPNKTYLALANEFDGSSNMGFSEKDERKKLKDDAANSNGVISCASNPAIERQFQHEYISDMFREVQTEFGKNGDCTIRAFAQEGDSVYVKVKEEKLVNEKTRIPTFYVLPRWSKNIKRKHTYIKSSHDVRRLDESHNLFRGLCANFFNVAQEFVTCDEEVAMLHAVLDDTRTKLTGYRAKMQSKSVADTHDSMAT